MKEPTPEEIAEIEKYNAFLRDLGMRSKQKFVANAGEFQKFLPPYLLLSLDAKGQIEHGESLLDLDEYQRLTKAYYEHQLDKIFIQTRTPGDVDDPISLSWKVTGDLDFFAYANADDGHAEIEISIGTIHALQDLAWRAASSENFFNVRPYDHRQHAAISRFFCYEPEAPWVPRHRYFDYNPRENKTPDTLEYLEYARAHGIEPDNLALFYRKLPMSEDRLALAQAMVNIALTWMFCHEEAHLRLGHLSDNVTDDWRGEHCIAMEWQADRSACKRVLTIFLDQNAPLPFLHPDLANSHIWRLRLISSSIGMAISLLDREHMVRGASDEHPSAKLRLAQLCKETVRASEDYLHGLQHYDFEESLGVIAELARFGEPLGQTFHLIEGVLWDVFSIIEIFDFEAGVGNRTSEHILLNNDAGSHVLAFVFAWGLDGKLDFRSGRAMPRSQRDEEMLHQWIVSVSKFLDVPMPEFLEMWLYASVLFLESHQMIIDTNIVVDELSPISKSLAMKNNLIKYI